MFQVENFTARMYEAAGTCRTGGCGGLAAAVAGKSGRRMGCGVVGFAVGRRLI